MIHKTFFSVYCRITHSIKKTIYDSDPADLCFCSSQRKYLSLASKPLNERCQRVNENKHQYINRPHYSSCKSLHHNNNKLICALFLPLPLQPDSAAALDCVQEGERTNDCARRANTDILLLRSLMHPGEETMQSSSSSEFEHLFG